MLSLQGRSADSLSHYFGEDVLLNQMLNKSREEKKKLEERSAAKKDELNLTAQILNLTEVRWLGIGILE
ncbi:hypothetical protein V6N12_042558 [Hibiscus sabdariffa]|uniref:Uncharacterized protein n=1 Tax=Hibiscus sabdariffa TaxID=183260 RepID=A0ABR2EF49_9ROSI